MEGGGRKWLLLPDALHDWVFPANTSLCKVSEASIADQV
jgi:hypothetical protein